MTTKLQKMASRLGDQAAETFNRMFKEKFGIEITTTFNIFEMALVSRRTDGESLTVEQSTWLDGLSEGYGEALGLVRAEASK